MSRLVQSIVRLVSAIRVAHRLKGKLQSERRDDAVHISSPCTSGDVIDYVTALTTLSSHKRLTRLLEWLGWV